VAFDAVRIFRDDLIRKFAIDCVRVLTEILSIYQLRESSKWEDEPLILEKLGVLREQLVQALATNETSTVEMLQDGLQIGGHLVAGDRTTNLSTRMQLNYRNLRTTNAKRRRDGHAD